MHQPSGHPFFNDQKILSRPHVPSIIVLITDDFTLSQFVDTGVARSQPTRPRDQRASRTPIRTPPPSGRLLAKASPLWNSAISRTM